MAPPFLYILDSR